MTEEAIKASILEWAYERALDHGGRDEGIFDLEDVQKGIDADSEALRRGVAILESQALLEIAMQPDVYRLSPAGVDIVDKQRKQRKERVRRLLLREMSKQEKNLKIGNQRYSGPGYFFASRLADDLKIERDRAIEAIASLESDGLVYPQPGVPTYGGPSGHAFGLTAEGREYLSTLQPAKAEQPGTTVNVYGSGATVLTGERAIAHVTQHIGQNQPEIRELLERMRAATVEIEDEALREESQEAIEVLSEELTADEPNPRRIKHLARGAWNLFREAAPLMNLAINLYDKAGLAELLA